MLFCGGDFVDYGLGGGAWVGSGGDGAAYDQEVGAGFDGFGGSCGAGLVIGSSGRAVAGVCDGAHAGSHDQKIAAAGFANRARFLHAGDNAIHSGGFCKLREFHDARFRRTADSYFAHGFLIHARQHRDGEQARTISAHRLTRTDCLRRGVQHRASTEGVYVDQLNARHGRGRQNRASDGVRNVVEFQIEKNARAERGNFLDRGRTGSGEKLAADFEHADEIGNLFGKLDRGIQRVKVESYDQAASRMGVEVQVCPGSRFDPSLRLPPRRL